MDVHAAGGLPVISPPHSRILNPKGLFRVDSSVFQCKSQILSNLRSQILRMWLDSTIRTLCADTAVVIVPYQDRQITYVDRKCVKVRHPSLPHLFSAF